MPEFFDLHPLTSRTGMMYGVAIAVLILLTWTLRRVGVVFFLTALPATVTHEMMHFLMAVVTFGQPRSFSVIPTKRGDQYVLGTVQCANMRWYNGALIALAPLLLLLPTLWTLHWRLASHPGFNFEELAWVYALACLLLGAIPSWQDLKVALSTSWFLLLLLLTGLWFWKFR